MSVVSIVEIADALRSARANRMAIPPIRRSLNPKDIESAYAIQKLNTNSLVADGAQRIGRKIGLTSIAVQRQLGVDQPDFGSLLDFMRHPATCPLSAGSLIAPKIEGEIAFRIGARIEGPDFSHKALIACIDVVAPALEVVDSAILGWDINIVDTIADNASCGVFVIGDGVKFPKPDDLASRSMVLTCDGDPISDGLGAATLGHPLNALEWLARVSIEQGEALQPGEWVLAGALGPMRPMTPGKYILNIQGFSPLELTVTP